MRWRKRVSKRNFPKAVGHLFEHFIAHFILSGFDKVVDEVCDKVGK